MATERVELRDRHQRSGPRQPDYSTLRRHVTGLVLVSIGMILVSVSVCECLVIGPHREGKRRGWYRYRFVGGEGKKEKYIQSKMNAPEY